VSVNRQQRSVERERVRDLRIVHDAARLQISA